MKKLILFAAILFAGVSVAMAQSNAKAGAVVTTADHLNLESGGTPSGNESSAFTELKVTLSAIQSISLNTANIHLKYETVNDYETGVSTGAIKDHLKVYSTGGFIVNVRYDDANDTNTDQDVDGMFSTIELGVTDNNDGNLSVDQNLSSSDNALLTSLTGGMGYTYDVDYRGLGGKAYLNFIKAGADRVYTANVYYTIVAQ